MSNRSDLNLALLYPYIIDNSVRDTPLLKALRDETAQDEMARMQIAPEQGQFMSLIIKLMGAKRIIEIGTFTGYSSLCMAQALPDDGLIICCDTSTDWTDIAKRYWNKAGVGHKIDLRIAPATDTLSSLINHAGTGTFDAAFIDADKENYDSYYEACLKLLKPGGLIMLDNMLWSGRVADETQQDADTQAIRALNQKLKNDKRIDLSLLPMADGITLALKL